MQDIGKGVVIGKHLCAGGLVRCYFTELFVKAVDVEVVLYEFGNNRFVGYEVYERDVLNAMSDKEARYERGDTVAAVAYDLGNSEEGCFERGGT